MDRFSRTEIALVAAITVPLAIYLGARYHPLIGAIQIAGLLWAAYDLGWFRRKSSAPDG